MSQLYKVCNVDEIPDGKGYSYEVNDEIVAVFHVEGLFYAIDDACPHMGASLSAGYLDGCIVACPLHAWRFDVRDGTWCDNPRVATDSYPVTVKNGEVFVSFEQQEDTAKQA
ncbi:MAG: Rieske (2Fe-2S) protein [Pirellulaceae bacterium]